MCSKITMKAPERHPKLTKTPQQRYCRHSVVFIVDFRRRSGVFIINFEHILHLFLVFLLLTLNM